jgi:hypothetical protein
MVLLMTFLTSQLHLGDLRQMTYDRSPQGKTASMDPLAKKLFNTAGKALHEMAAYAAAEIYELKGLKTLLTTNVQYGTKKDEIKLKTGVMTPELVAKRLN